MKVLESWSCDIVMNSRCFKTQDRGGHHHPPRADRPTPWDDTLTLLFHRSRTGDGLMGDTSLSGNTTHATSRERKNNSAHTLEVSDTHRSEVLKGLLTGPLCYFMTSNWNVRNIQALRVLTASWTAHRNAAHTLTETQTYNSHVQTGSYIFSFMFLYDTMKHIQICHYLC